MLTPESSVLVPEAWPERGLSGLPPLTQAPSDLCRLDLGEATTECVAAP
jgi:hypothetical protein